MRTNTNGTQDPREAAARERHRRARQEYNRTRATMAAQIAAGIAVYDALTSPPGEARMNKRDVAAIALGIADEIVKLIKEGEPL